MKIIVLHGDDTVKSYERLKKFIETAKERSWEVSYLDESTQSLQENLSSPSLFGNERFFILRDIKHLGKKEVGWISKKYKELPGNLIIYHEGIINPSTLKSLPKDITVEEFNLPVLVWKFLEGLLSNKAEESVRLLHKIIEKEPPEFIFSLIARHFRDLYWSKVDPASMLFPTWKISKLKSQSSKFSEEQLRKVIGILSDVDIDVKTSKADLLSSLDLMILKQLE